MSTSPGLDKIQQQLDVFLAELDKQTGEAMERVTDAMTRTGKAAAMLQEAELNTFVIEAFLKARERLMSSLEKSKSSPLLSAMISQQIDNLECELVDEMANAGLPKSAAKKAIEAATHTVEGHIAQREQPRHPKGKPEGGQYAPKNRLPATNGAH